MSLGRENSIECLLAAEAAIRNRRIETLSQPDLVTLSKSMGTLLAAASTGRYRPKPDLIEPTSLEFPNLA